MDERGWLLAQELLNMRDRLVRGLLGGKPLGRDRGNARDQGLNLGGLTG
jgi:hypothetical protein